MKTLEQIIEEEKTKRTEKGIYGIKACKERILSRLESNKKFNKENSEKILPATLFEMLEDYYIQANEERPFNKTMVLACWELINKI